MRRNTIQREVTLETVRKLDNHATAEEIYTAVAEKHPTVSRATIYRLLHDLSESGEILRVPIPNGADHFDHRCNPHHHAQCTVCDRVFDIDTVSLDLLTAIKDAHGFRASGYDLIFRGICAECMNAHREEADKTVTCR